MEAVCIIMGLILTFVVYVDSLMQIPVTLTLFCSYTYTIIISSKEISLCKCLIWHCQTCMYVS